MVSATCSVCRPGSPVDRTRPSFAPAGSSTRRCRARPAWRRTDTSATTSMPISSGSRPTAAQCVAKDVALPASTARACGRSSRNRHDAPRPAVSGCFSPATHPDRWVRRLERLRIAVGAHGLVVGALVRRLRFGPHRAHDLDALTEHADAVLRLGELVAVHRGTRSRTIRRRCPSRGAHRRPHRQST